MSDLCWLSAIQDEDSMFTGSPRKPTLRGSRDGSVSPISAGAEKCKESPELPRFLADSR